MNPNSTDRNYFCLDSKDHVRHKGLTPISHVLASTQLTVLLLWTGLTNILTCSQGEQHDLNIGGKGWSQLKKALMRN